MPAANPPTNPRGRPREFDLEAALDRAIPVFCSGGFHGTSLNDLAEGMQLTQGSIYKAFKDKRQLFFAALSRQEMFYADQLRTMLEKAGSGHEMLRAALLFYAGLAMGSEGMQGCLVVTTAVELAASDREIAQRVSRSFRRRQKFLAELICQGHNDGSIPKHVDSEGTAWMMLFLFQGLRVVGKTGIIRKELTRAVDAAMKTLR
jgi:AcrR family transcriptional regulator